MNSRVESIIPDYPVAPELTKDSGHVTEVDTVDCFKLILTKPYNGEGYSIVLKHRTSAIDLHNIISRIEIEKLHGKSLSFTYHHVTRRGKVITMIVTMNTNIHLNMYVSCAYRFVRSQRWKPSGQTTHDTSVINYRAGAILHKTYYVNCIALSLFKL